MNGKRAVTLSAIAILGASLAFGQGAAPRATAQTDNLRQGIELFAAARYAEALPLFDALFLDPSAGALRAEGAYWSAMTNLAAGNPGAAEKAIEAFLSAFPGHARTPELLYQKARAAFLQKDYERAVRAFQAYMAAYPDGEQVAASVFWSAESLYSLGRLPEAEKLYKTIGERYADSVKAEAAKYRLSLIQFKYREDELLTLLKWSHEESLRTIEEFQRREKAYEQALAVYQKRYGETKAGGLETQATLEEQLASLKASVDDLARRLQEKDGRIAELERALVDSQAALAKAAQAAASAVSLAGAEVPATSPTGNPAETALLGMKERALALMQVYLEKLAQEGTGRSE